ncbi:hypothetical protein like AT3G56220 [Hibiscus trionum]|uniref:Plant bHLH transcription factor ACT-like domain-containing protein n=1 Tax=Hibiscus trionum TaxID=183268 RepID=A0A9W7M800_HIBTR|nr:hypothetical protein like AT3G56220 [Hibiscus trionum]
MKKMVSRERKTAAAMNRKMRVLRSITNSHAHGKTSIILDATKYLEDLKQKLEKINKDIAMPQNSTCYNSYPVQLRVEAQDKGFLIKVFSERCCGGLFVFVLEAFEELGLEVFQARVSCSESFLLEAVGIKDDKESNCLDAEDVKRAVSKAIQNWSTQVN